MARQSYWHRMSEKQINKVCGSGMEMEEFLKVVYQPTWCQYPNALSGIMGCWSLMSSDTRRKISHKFCGKEPCEYYRAK